MNNIAHPTCRKIALYTAIIGFNAVLGVGTTHAKYTLEEVVVTATKKASAEMAQDVGIAVTAISGDTIENRFMSDLTDVGNLAPNVQMSAAGTTPGTPSFFIRGMGIFSSIPSDEPAVGIIQDGIYLGVNSGSMTSLFDVESVEVLRGPQGTLFGRNVTGGAVVVNSRRPT
jgi:outer membrane receptor protein involved in Fe transport